MYIVTFTLSIDKKVKTNNYICRTFEDARDYAKDILSYSVEELDGTTLSRFAKYMLSNINMYVVNSRDDMNSYSDGYGNTTDYIAIDIVNPVEVEKKRKQQLDRLQKRIEQKQKELDTLKQAYNDLVGKP